MEDKASGNGWAAYLARFHQHRAGITERLLTRTDRSPYAWLADAVRDDQGPVLDLACGSAPTRPLLPSAAWVGVDSSFSELELAGSTGRTPLVQAKAQELPVRDRAVRVVCAAMCLQVLTPLDSVLAEVKRVLAPGASLVALVPSSRLYSPAGVWRWLRILRALGLRNQPWPNPKARDGLARVLGNHGFVVDADDRAVFDVDVSDPAALGLLIGSLYLPGVPAGRVATAKRALTPLARPGRTLPMPLRRVVAHCPAEAPP